MTESHAMMPWQAVFSVLLGLTYVLAGYRTMRFTARVTSSFLFMGLGALVCTHVENPWAIGTVLVGSAIVGFILGNAFYYVNMAGFGAGAGLVIAAVMMAALGKTIGWGSGISGAVAGAILAVLFERPIGIFGTSVVGAALASVSVQSLMMGGGRPEPNKLALGYVALFAGLTALGCFIQARTTKNLPARAESGKAPVR